MKKILPFVLIVFVIISSCKKDNKSSGNLTTGWTNQGKIDDGYLNDIFFPDNTTGYAAGQFGIYKSTNGGAGWSRINNTRTESVGAANASSACFTNGGTKPYITNDGGNSFDSTEYFAPDYYTANFTDCFFSGTNTCYLATSTHLWKSTNGGNSFDSIYNFQISSSGSDKLFFLNDQVGWIIRGEGIYKTTDGGITWNVLFNSDLSGDGAIDFIDEDHGFYAANNIYAKTSDGGITWETIYQADISGGHSDIDFINANEGYISNNSKIYKTSDGGITWTNAVEVYGEDISEIHFNDSNHGWACTDHGEVLKYVQ